MALLYVKPCLLGKIVCVWLNGRLGIFLGVFRILALEFDTNMEFVNTISCARPMPARNDGYFRRFVGVSCSLAFVDSTASMF